MRLQFPYRIEPSLPSSAHPTRASIARPRIRIRLSHGNRFVDLLALVDSGADDCLFPFEVATVLRLPLAPGAVHRYGGIGEGVISAQFGTVTLEVGKWTFPLYADNNVEPDDTTYPLQKSPGLIILPQKDASSGKLLGLAVDNSPCKSSAGR